MRILYAMVAALLVWMSSAPSVSAQAAKEHRVVAAKWENGKPVSTEGNFGSGIRLADDYLVHYPEGSFFGADKAELYRFENGVLRRVKDAQGAPLRFFYPALHRIGADLYVHGRTGYGAGKKEKKDDALWHVSGLVASPVLVDNKPLIRPSIEFCRVTSPYVTARSDSLILYKLAGPTATVVADLTALVPDGHEHDVTVTAVDTLVTLKRENSPAEPESLHVLRAGKLEAVKDGSLKSFGAPSVTVRLAGSQVFVTTFDKETGGSLWRYAGGTVEPVTMPDGTRADGIGLLGVKEAGNRLVFSRDSEKDGLDYQWVVGSGTPEPLLTVEGKHMRGWAVVWYSRDARLVASVFESEDASEGGIWLYEGDKAVALTGTDGKPLLASLPSFETAGRWTILRQNIDAELNYRFWLFDGPKNVGQVRRENGNVLEGPGLSAHAASNGVYIGERHEKQTRLYWLALK